jgi:hypothetical protein
VTAHAYKTIVLHCDRPGCLVKIVLVSERITEARRQACSESGWRYVHLPLPNRQAPAAVADLCPDHVDYPIALAEVREAPARKAG